MRTYLFTAFIVFFPLHFWAQDAMPGHTVWADTAGISEMVSSARKLKLSDPDSAAVLLQKAVVQSEALGYRLGKFKALMQMGEVKMYMGRSAAAMTAYTDAMKNAADSNEVASVRNFMAHVYYLEGDYEDAAAESYKVIEAANRNPRLGINAGGAYVNLFVIWNQLGDHQKAKQYLDQAEAAAANDENPSLLADVLNKQGNRYLSEKKYSTALRYYQRSIDVSRTCGNTGMEMMATQNIGAYYERQGNMEMSLRYSRAALSFIERPDISPFYKISVLVDAADSYRKMKRYGEAEKLLMKSLQLAKKAHARVYAVKPYLRLSEIYAETNRYEQAVKMQELYAPLKDSIINNEKIKAINALEFKYKMLLKDNEIARNQLLVEREKNIAGRKGNYMVILLLSAALLAGVGIYLYRNIRYRQKLQDETMHLAAQQQQIQLLKATISGEENERTRIGRELHDGTGSMLSVIKMGLSVLRNEHPPLLRDTNFSGLIQLVDEATSEVRDTAHSLMLDPLLKGGMEEALTLFCNSVQKKSGLQLTFQYYGEMPRLDAAIERSLFRVIKELVQYRIANNAGALLLQLNWQTDILSVIVEDDGIAQCDGTARTWDMILSRAKLMYAHIDVVCDGMPGTMTDVEFDLQRLCSNKNEYA